MKKLSSCILLFACLVVSISLASKNSSNLTAEVKALLAPTAQLGDIVVEQDIEIPLKPEMTLPNGYTVSYLIGRVGFSPDGRYLAIEMGTVTLASLATVILDSRSNQIISFAPGYDFNWAEDGRTVFYTEHRYYEGGGSHEVRVSNPFQPGQFYPYESGRVIYDDRGMQSRHNIMGVAFPYEALSGESTPVPSSLKDVALFPALSPNQRYWVYSRKGPMGEPTQLWLASREGTPLVQLTQSDGMAVLPTWSPDGTRIAYKTLKGSFDEDGVFNYFSGEAKVRVLSLREE